MDTKIQIFLQIWNNYKEGNETKIGDIDYPSKYHYIGELIKDKLIKKDGVKLILLDKSRGKQADKLLPYPDLVDEKLAKFIHAHNNRENRVKIDTVNTSGYRHYLKLLKENNQIHCMSHKPLVFGYMDKDYINNLLAFFGYAKTDFDEKEILVSFFPEVCLDDNQKQHLAFLEKMLHEMQDMDIEEGKLKDILIFRGGTCLSLYYILYRLSIDLDFVYCSDILKRGDSETKSQFNKKIENINRMIRDNVVEICRKNGLETINVHFTGGGKSLRITFLDGFEGNIDITYPGFEYKKYCKVKEVYVDSIENILGDKLVILFSRENAKITDLTDIFYILKMCKLDKDALKMRMSLKLKDEGVGIEFILGADPVRLSGYYMESHESRDRLLFMLPRNHPVAEVRDFAPFIRYVQTVVRGLYEGSR